MVGCCAGTVMGNRESIDTYTMGIRNGEALLFSPNGNRIKQENYVNDTLDGIVKQWYEDATLKLEGQYRNGLFDGKWVYYNPDGGLVGVGNYDLGTGVQKGWWPNGNLKREIHYRNNVKHGVESWYNEVGELIKQVNYLDGVEQ